MRRRVAPLVAASLLLSAGLFPLANASWEPSNSAQNPNARVHLPAQESPRISDESSRNRVRRVLFEPSDDEFDPYIESGDATAKKWSGSEEMTESSPPLHKPLFPLDATDFWGFFAAAIGLMIAASGGIGGGGVLVPIYILVMGFRTKFGIPLSNVTILGGSITNVYLNLKKRHPMVDRPLVDWDLILVMEPLTIAGAVVGSFLNKILPDLILVVLLVVLLAVTAQRTLQKGFKKYTSESKEHAKAKESELTRITRADNDDQIVEESESLIDRSDSNPDAEPISAELQAIYDRERKTPTDKVIGLVGVMAVVLAINLLKGGGAFDSPLGIVCGSFGFWFLTSLILVWILVVSWYVRKILMKDWQDKKRLGYRFVAGDVEWSPKNTIKYPALCFFAGFFAGMFGVGGGIIKGPLMLEMGVDPQVSAATSAVMIFFTSLTASTSFWVFGLVRVDYAVPLFVLGLIATAIGQVGVGYLVKKYNRTSYIILSIGSIVALSALLMGLQGVISLFSNGSSHSGTICGAGE